jgi:HK97 family phage prohead protease
MQFAQVQKFVAAGTRKIRGIASSDSLDLAGDIVTPTGGKWSLPLPLLWAHDHLQPIGRVVEAEVRGSAIYVVAEVASGVPKADEVWELLERQLAASFSIGFIGERGEPIATGTRWTKWTWVELSVVTVPANQDARITATRAAGSGDGSVKLINHAGAVRLVRSG